MATHFQTRRLHRAQPLQLGVLAGRICKQRRRLLILEVGQISRVLWVARERRLGSDCEDMGSVGTCFSNSASLPTWLAAGPRE